MAEETSREEELERRIAELERRQARSDRFRRGASTTETAFWALMHRVFPADARRHMKAATREQLMAARTYLDRWIAGLGDEPAEPPANDRPRERIEIE
jgi:hypothetical protein